jgi:hypothetical protein
VYAKRGQPVDARAVEGFWREIEKTRESSSTVVRTAIDILSTPPPPLLLPPITPHPHFRSTSFCTDEAISFPFFFFP